MKLRENVMFRRQTISIMLLASVVVLGSSFDIACAATKGKKLTYEQAWAHCKGILDKEKTPGTTTMGNERMVRGGACMKHYGYNL
jgi:hypothetical protein